MSDTQNNYLTIDPFTAFAGVLYAKECSNCGESDTGITVEDLSAAMSEHVCREDDN